jgi:hypothetical protein
MRLVPRQLRRSDFPGSVPYYGGRLTPQVIAGLNTSAAPAGRPADVQAQLMGAVQVLLAHGMLTRQEHIDIVGRIEGGP